MSKRKPKTTLPPFEGGSKPPTSGPIHVAMPNTVAEKMKAIVSLSKAVEELAKTLGSVNVQTAIVNCTLYGNTGAGILMDFEQHKNPGQTFAAAIERAAQEFHRAETR